MNRKFWLIIVALLVLMLALEYQMPRRFQWEPTFAHADRQPFGCYVFDSIFSQEMPHGYTVCRKSLSQLALQDTTPRSIVILCTGYQHQAVNRDTLFALAHRGYHILVTPTYVDWQLFDTLRVGYNNYGNFNLKSIQGLQAEHEYIYWTGDSAHYKPDVYSCYKQMIDLTFRYNDSVRLEVLAHINNGDTLTRSLAISYPIGRGEIILVSTPRLLTNYGVLNHPGYVHRLMNRLRDLPIVRTEAYMPNYDVTQESPFRELLKRPPLRWALYLVLLGIVLLMGFNARRRQRAIPVEQPPRNYQLDFIRHIGTMQYLKNNQ